MYDADIIPLLSPDFIFRNIVKVPHVFLQKDTPLIAEEDIAL